MTGEFYGIGKLTEEIGELNTELGALLIMKQQGRLLQLLGKGIAFPANDHPDGKGPIRVRIMDELADLRAILAYFSNENFSPEEIKYMGERVDEKLGKFFKWGLTGVPIDTIEPKRG